MSIPEKRSNEAFRVANEANLIVREGLTEVLTGRGSLKRFDEWASKCSRNELCRRLKAYGAITARDSRVVARAVVYARMAKESK